MKGISIILLLLSAFLTSQGQSKHPGTIEIRGLTIGKQVDTNQFKKLGSLYFPNYLNGWTMDNVSELPKKYKGLPIGLWQLKSDSSIVLTLLRDKILNFTISFMKTREKDSIAKVASSKFGIVGQVNAYEEVHPLQSYITYWNLQTWQTVDAILQIGTSEMRSPKDEPEKNPLWNLVYSDFILERKIIAQYKNEYHLN
jgi:hypothetical protein